METRDLPDHMQHVVVLMTDDLRFSPASGPFSLWTNWWLPLNWCFLVRSRVDAAVASTKIVQCVIQKDTVYSGSFRFCWWRRGNCAGMTEGRKLGESTACRKGYNIM